MESKKRDCEEEIKQLLATIVAKPIYNIILLLMDKGKRALKLMDEKEK